MRTKEENIKKRYFEVIIGGRYGFTSYFKTTKPLPDSKYDDAITNIAMACGELDRSEVMDLVSAFEIPKEDIPEFCEFIEI